MRPTTGSPFLRGSLRAQARMPFDWTTRRPSISYSMDGTTLTIYEYPSCTAFRKRCNVWVEAVDPARHRCRNSEPLLRTPSVNPARACRGFGADRLDHVVITRQRSLCNAL